MQPDQSTQTSTAPLPPIWADEGWL